MKWIHSTRRAGACAAALVCAVALGLALAPSAGARHKGFIAANPKPGGVITHFGKKPSFALAAAAQADGKLLVCGLRKLAPRRPAFVITRYTASGALDWAFGKVTVNFGGPATASAVQALPDGRILVAGEVVVAERPSADDGSSDFAIARLHPDGSLDRSFGDNGRATVELGGDDELRSMALQPDGKILLAGVSDLGYPDNTFAEARFGLARLEPDGEIDHGFGNDGKVVTPFSRYAAALDLTVQGNGDISLAGLRSADPQGSFESDLAMARYESDGDLDTSFGQGGKIVTPVIAPGEDGPAGVDYGEVDDVSFDDRGRAVLAASVIFNNLKRRDQTRIERYTSDGVPDA